MAIIEWKPVTSQVDSVADYYSNALAASLAAQQAFEKTGETFNKVYSDTQKGKLIKDLISGYDPNDLQSYNKSLKLAGATYYGIDPDMLEKLNGDTRVKMNAQLDVDNLNINKQLMAEAQAKINEAQANADIAGLKRANSAATKILDANGNAVRTDAYTLGQVDPLLNSASRRALEGAQARAVRQKAKDELDTKNFNNYVASSSQNIAMRIPPSLIGTPAGNQMIMDLSMQAAGAAEGIPNQSALVSAIAQGAIKQAQWLQSNGVDTTLFGTPADTFSYQSWDENGNSKTLTVDPRYADSVLNQAAIAYQDIAEEQATKRDAEQFGKESRQHNIEDIQEAFSKGDTELAQTLINTINKEGSKYSEEQKALVNDMAKLYQLDQEIAKTSQEQPTPSKLTPWTTSMFMMGANYNSNPIGTLAANYVAPQQTQLQTLQTNREKLAQSIKERQEAIKKEAEVDEFDAIIAANDFTPTAQAKVTEYANNAVSEATTANADALSAVSNMLDKDGVETGNNSLVTNIVAALTIKDGKVPDDMGTLSQIIGSDGKPLNKEQSSKLEGKEAAKLIVEETTNMRGNRQITTMEANEIQQDFNKAKRQFADALQASNNFGGNASDAQAIASALAMDAIRAAIEKNSGLAALYDDYDYHSSDLNDTIKSTLKILRGEDPQVQQLFDAAARNNMYAKQFVESLTKYQEKADLAYSLSKDMKRRGTAQKALGQEKETDLVPTFLAGMGMGATAATTMRAKQNLKGQ